MLGPGQMESSRSLWGIERFDLVQIHNMLAWEGHLETLLADKQARRVRYVGMTTSHGRRHDDLAAAMAAQPLDFVQFSYSVADREAERHLLPLAAERRLAVIVNRPFDGGDLFQLVEGEPLPDWAAEFDCANWAQFFLKFVVAHPAVTCAIPATSQIEHMEQNMGALRADCPIRTCASAWRNTCWPLGRCCRSTRTRSSRPLPSRIGPCGRRQPWYSC